MSKKNENEKPEVYSLKKGKDSWQFSRRDFLKAAAVGAATVGIGLTVGSKKVVHAADDLSSLCATAKAHNTNITHLAVSPDSRLLASGSEDRAIKIWDLQTCALIAEKKEEAGFSGIFAMVFAPDESGTMLLYVADQNKVACYEPENDMKVKHTNYLLPGDLQNVNAFAALGDDRLCVLCDTTIITLSRSLNAISKVKMDIPASDESIWKWGWSYGFLLPSENVLIGGNARTENPVIRVDLSSGTYTKLDLEGNYSAMKRIPGDSRILVRHDLDPNNAVVRLSDGAEMWTAPLEGGIMAVTPDGMYAVMINNNKREYSLVDLNTGETVKTLGSETADLQAMEISPDGTKLISAVGKALMIRSLPDGKLLGCPVDLSVMKTNEKGVEVEVKDEVTGITTTVTLPCGSPIPDGATCVCNCVAGEVCPCVGNCSCDGYTCGCVGNTCSCEGNCTCNTVSDGSHYWYPN